MTRTGLWPDPDFAMNARHPDPLCRPASRSPDRQTSSDSGPWQQGKRGIRGSRQRAVLLGAVLAAHMAALVLLFAPTRPPAPAALPPILVTLLPAPQAAPEVVPPAPTPTRPQPPPPKAVSPKAKAPTPPLPRAVPTPAAAPRPVASEPAPMAPSHPAPVADPAPASVSAPSSPAAPTPVNAAPPTAPRFDAAYLNNQTPYPPLARRLRESGTVRLRVLVSAQGAAERIELISSSGSPRLDEGAMEAVRRWRFIPARQGEHAVASSVVVPIIYKLEEF